MLLPLSALYVCCPQYGTHYATYVNNTLAALKNATDSGVTLPVATSNLTGELCAVLLSLAAGCCGGPQPADMSALDINCNGRTMV